MRYMYNFIGIWIGNEEESKKVIKKMKDKKRNTVRTRSGKSK